MEIPIILNGKFLSRKIEEDLKLRIEKIKDNSDKIPKLATILVGNDVSSEIYVNMKRKACSRIGLDSHFIHLPQNTTTELVSKVIEELNSNNSVYGILLQHPVPKHIDERYCFNKIKLEKDVDGVTSEGFGKISMKEYSYGSATAVGIMSLVKHYNLILEGKNAVIVGRSPILGKPIAMMMLNENATVTICHSKTKDLELIVNRANIVVGAVGIPEYIKSDWISNNSIVIDAGYHKGGVGDIEINKVKDRTYAYTPVPGGVGPMTIATLLSQTVLSIESKLLNKS